MNILNRDLHIIALNIPYPPDYGGIIDCFHRIRLLHYIGINIHLHCFEYGREHSRVIESLCRTVNYYPRDISFIKQISFIPYSVISRGSKQLLENLTKDDFPILFDGIQTTLYLGHSSLTGRNKIVRVHNIEHSYYNTLAEYEKNPAKKLYYFIESLKLKYYETILARATTLLTVSQIDQDHFETRYHNSEIVPSFHPYDQIEILPGTGQYILYHGDLSINENVTISEYLISEIFSKIPFQCIIAGKNPPKHLQDKASFYNNISLIANPREENMSRLIKEAQINVLPTRAANGLKLKLLLSLFSGRHCLVNSTTISGTGLDKLCQVADSGEEMIRKIHDLMAIPFTVEMIADRKKVLSENNDNLSNAKKIEKLII